jgi:GDP-L-fucose synthase
VAGDHLSGPTLGDPVDMSGSVLNTECRVRPRVAILGGSGFVGRNVLEELEAAGLTVGTFSRRSGCDLLNVERALATLRGFRPSHLVNCAAVVGSVNYVSDFAAEVTDANARLVLSVCRIAQRLSGVIVVNLVANCVYPGASDTCEEAHLWDGPLHPSVHSYGETRRLLLTLAESYRSQYGMRSVNLIVPNLYGPYDSTDPNKTHALNALILKFLRAVRSQAQAVEVWGTGRPIREWLFVRDIARVVRQVVESAREPAQPVNIAQNTGYSINQLLDIIGATVGYHGGIVYNTAYGDGAPKKVMDDRYFRVRFPTFTFTALADGVRETIEYYGRVLDAEIASGQQRC